MMNFVDVFYSSDDGLTLYARDYAGPAPGAPVVLCLPGLTRNSRDFAALAGVLAQTCRVICPDMRGRGRSMRDPDPAGYRPERYVRDMITLLDFLGIGKVVVIGTSLGGMMAMILMALVADRIRAVVLNDVGPVVDARGLARIAGYVGKSVPVDTWEAAALQTAHINAVAFPDYGPDDWLAMARAMFVEQGSKLVLDYDPAIAQSIADGVISKDFWPLFENMPPKPMLVIRGALSDILSAETQQEMARRLPNVSNVTIAGRGHAPTLGEPDALPAITGFLSRLNA